MSNLQIFNYEKIEVQAAIIDGNPWFVAKNVCDVLEIKNNRQAIENLDDDEKLLHTLNITGQNRKVWVINESGLYNLIFRSNKPEAKKIRKWVTAEVLPTIRKTGGYDIDKQNPKMLTTEGNEISVLQYINDPKEMKRFINSTVSEKNKTVEEYWNCYRAWEERGEEIIKLKNKIKLLENK